MVSYTIIGKETKTMSSHHELGPSRYPAWAVCPRYRSDDRDTPESSAGTDAHAELAKALTDGEYIPSSLAARWAADWILSEAKGAEVHSETKVTGTLDGVSGIFGTVDAMWTDADGVLHIADFKTFSDGTADYMPQLRGYAALHATEADLGKVVVLHVLHGMACRVEDERTTFADCIDRTKAVLESVNSNKPAQLCKYCTFCANIKECPMTNNALTTVSENTPAFSNLSTCQKLVVLDAVDKLSKTIREQAKKEAQENGGFIEQDGIRYEMKPWADPSKCRDIGEVAGAMDNLWVDKSSRKGDSCSIHANGLTSEKLLATCTLSKTALVAAMKDANPESKLTKADWERWADRFFDKTEGAPHFVRVK
jgi:hypothetical protein